MKLIKLKALLVAVSVCLAVASCADKWDDHNALDNQALSQKVLDKIKSDPSLSKFAQYLITSGLDSVLLSSKSFTVWAPTNEALQAIDPALIDTKEELKLFIGNHIATQMYLTSSTGSSFIRVKTVNGKNVSFSASAVDGINLISVDDYVGDGVMHKINSAIVPKVSAWEYLMSTNTIQKDVLTKMTYKEQDLTNAIEVGINPVTGRPIYKPGTDSIARNSFLHRVDVSRTNRADISQEDSVFTYIVLTNTAFESERLKLSKYYKLGISATVDSTKLLTDFSIIKDLAFKGILDKENFPATSYSVGDSVKFHLKKSAVVETKLVSNGIVYVMNSIDYDLIGANGSFDPYTKIKPIILQGENINNNVDFLSVKTNTRPVRRDNNGTLYTQLMVENHATSSYWARYRPNTLNSTKYKVVWRVVRFNNLVPATAGSAGDLTYFPMRVAFGKPDATTAWPYIPKPGVLPLVQNGQQVYDSTNRKVFVPDYEERELGLFTSGRFYSSRFYSNYVTSGVNNGAEPRFPIFLVSNNVTTNGANTLLLDYIKLIPVE